MTDYSKPSISGYNDSPPADDGSASSENKVLYSTHKTKLADPIATYAAAINSAANTAFAALDADTQDILSKDKGSSPPANIPIRVGSLWLDDSTVPWRLKIYDQGGDWTTLWEIDPVGNKAVVPGGVVDGSLDYAAITNDHVLFYHIKLGGASVSAYLGTGGINLVNFYLVPYAFFPMIYSASYQASLNFSTGGDGGADGPRFSLHNDLFPGDNGWTTVAYEYVLP